MQLSKYEPVTQELLVKSQKFAKEYEHQAIEPEHLLLALLNSGDILALLKKLSVSKTEIYRVVQVELVKLPNVAASATFLSPKFIKLTANAEVIATAHSSSLVKNEHLLAAMADIDAIFCPGGVILKRFGVTKDKIMALVAKGAKASAIGAKPVKPGSTEILQQFTEDLAEQARLGHLDPLIGRDLELRRICQVLSRRNKFNPVLIGEPGVGKNTIIKGLAARIARGDVPSVLAGKELRSLDVGALLAGASLRGQFEERLKNLLAELKESAGQVLLFINEIHTLVGAGGEGASDAANMLKPALARGDIQILGACTLDEYKKSIEKDAALDRRFQPVFIDEPNSSEALQILRGIKEKYELFHGVRIFDDSLQAAINFAIRYITNRALPDKAIDLIDEACSHLRLSVEALPENLDKEQRELTRQKMEVKSLEKSKSEKAKKEKLKLNKAIKVKEKRVADLKSHWEDELALVQAVRALKEGIASAQNELLQAERGGLIEKGSKLKYETLKGLKSDLETKTKALTSLQKKSRMIREEVEPADIAKVVACLTGIPVHRMLEGEKQKLVQMESRLGKRVIGQLEAIAGVASSVRRSRAGIQDPERPLGSFLFLGPTGVGKTELAKALSDFLFDDEKSMIRFDMSEFMEKHTVARLIGAPPGYKGADEGGQFTEAVRRKPYSVVLFDEMEKAHPDVLNILLQILDDGRLSDSQGRLIDFRNTVIIMTSNVGSFFLLEATLQNGEIDSGAKKQVLAELKSQFRPEFLNRIDEIVMFHGLGLREIEKIADIQLKKLNELLLLQQIKLTFVPSAKKALIKAGFEPAYGARPLKRAIQKLVQDPLSLALLEGRFKPQDAVEVKLKKKSGAKAQFDFWAK